MKSFHISNNCKKRNIPAGRIYLWGGNDRQVATDILQSGLKISTHQMLHCKSKDNDNSAGISLWADVYLKEAADDHFKSCKALKS